MTKITEGAFYISSIKGHNLNVYLFGEKVVEPATKI